jgi:hypothetical protein
MGACLLAWIEKLHHDFVAQLKLANAPGPRAQCGKLEASKI